MKRTALLFAIPALILSACIEKSNPSDIGVRFVDPPKPFKKEIPRNRIGEYAYSYQLAKHKQQQLGLDSLENGFDNLQIRVWYETGEDGQAPLIMITNKDSRWAATVYYLKLDWDGRHETVVSKEVRQVTPKSGWLSFSGKLLDLNIIELPNAETIPGYEIAEADGKTVSVEIATKNQYRFYKYWEPGDNAQKIWQARTMTEILKLFKDELGVSPKAYWGI